MQPTPRLGQPYGARQAVEQLHPQQFLQPAYLVAQRPRRHVQLPGRPRQAQMPGGGVEGAQGVQRRQWLQHEIFSIIL